jgi:hypothetical protein
MNVMPVTFQKAHAHVTLAVTKHAYVRPLYSMAFFYCPQDAAQQDSHRETLLFQIKLRHDAPMTKLISIAPSDATSFGDAQCALTY